MNKEEILRPLQLLHWSLVGGLVVILVIFTFVLQDPEDIIFDLEADAYLILGGLLVVLAMLSTKYIRIPQFDKRWDDLSEDELIQLRSRYMLLWATIEASALINAMLFFVSGNGFFMVCAMTLLVLLAFQRPAVDS